MSKSKSDSAHTSINKKEEIVGTLTWTVDNLNFLVEGKMGQILSPVFSTVSALTGYERKWKLGLEIDKFRPKCICLTLAKCEHDNYKCSFKVFNLKNGKYIRDLKKRSSNGRCYIEFLQLYDIESIRNDALKIICDITLETYEIISKSTLENKCVDGLETSQNRPNLEEYLKNLLLEDQFSDVKLVAPCGKELNAHKCILAARSPTFAAMFSHDMFEKQSNIVKITDINYDVLKEMLQFIYTAKVENIKTFASELFIAADKYDIQDLKSQCANYIADNITIENAIEIFEFADKCNAEKLKTRVLNFVKSNIASIMETDAFKKLQVKEDSLPNFILFLLQ